MGRYLRALSKSVKQEMDREQTRRGKEEGLAKYLSSPSFPHRLWHFSFSCAGMNAHGFVFLVDCLLLSTFSLYSSSATY